MAALDQLVTKDLPPHVRGLLGGLGYFLSPAGPRARLSIVIYHRVLTAPDPMQAGLLTADEFDWQVRVLARCFNVLNLSEALWRLEEGALPARSVCITFDDGYADNCEVALPILQRHGVPATFFVSTGFLNGGRMFNDTIGEALKYFAKDALDLESLGLGRFELSTPGLRCAAIERILSKVKALPLAERQAVADDVAARCGPNDDRALMMTTAQVRVLAKAGMEIGGHTVNHPILASLNEAEAREEMTRGKADLEDIIQAPVEYFAYPNGRPGVDYTGVHARLAELAGFRGAVTTAHGVSTSHADKFQLPRFTPWDKTPARFALRLMYNCTRANPAIC